LFCFVWRYEFPELKEGSIPLENGQKVTTQERRDSVCMCTRVRMRTRGQE
jgi:hypothetical protein